MKVNDHIYFSESIGFGKRKKYIRKIENEKNIENLFFLIYRGQDANLLEIVDSTEFYRLSRFEENVGLYGLTSNAEEAIDWVMHLVERTYKTYGEVSKNSVLMELNKDEKDSL